MARAELDLAADGRKQLSVSDGHAKQLHTDRARVLDAAYERHTERFVRKRPVPPRLPTAAWINTPADTKEVAH